MNNLSSYCGLVDAKIRASDKDLPVGGAEPILLVTVGHLLELNYQFDIFNYSRQHSVKQRILDADTKNSVGITGPIEEIAHNALAFCWNPYESPAKVIN